MLFLLCWPSQEGFSAPNCKVVLEIKLIGQLFFRLRKISTSCKEVFPMCFCGWARVFDGLYLTKVVLIDNFHLPEKAVGPLSGKKGKLVTKSSKVAQFAGHGFWAKEYLAFHRCLQSLSINRWVQGCSQGKCTVLFFAWRRKHTNIQWILKY